MIFAECWQIWREDVNNTQIDNHKVTRNQFFAENRHKLIGHTAFKFCRIYYFK